MTATVTIEPGERRVEIIKINSQDGSRGVTVLEPGDDAVEIETTDHVTIQIIEEVGEEDEE
jgi:cytidylate kinase